MRRSQQLSQVKLFSHLFCALLAGCLLVSCGASSSANSDDVTGANNDEVDTATLPADVSDDLIFTGDTSVTVDAVSRGLNLRYHLLRTQFHCYYSRDVNGFIENDFSSPHSTVDISEKSYVGTGIFGKQSGGFRDKENSDSFYLQDTDGKEFSFRIRFDVFGQWFKPGQTRSQLIGCYQSGASHERIQHQFLLNTPEAGTYGCTVGKGGVIEGEDLPLTLHNGNAFSINGSTGQYSYQNIVEEAAGSISFDAEPLVGWTGQYTENADTGEQRLVLQHDSGSAAICDKSREPRPFKRFGPELVTPPKASSVPLTGVYFLDTGNSKSVGWAIVTADGFMSTEFPLPGALNCRRIQANGLEACTKYVYSGGRKITLSRMGQKTKVPLTRGSDGSLTLGSGHYLPVVTPSVSELAGQWELKSATTRDHVDVSMCILGYCGPTGVSTSIYEFNEDGRFRYVLSSKAVSSVNIPDVNVFSSSSSQGSKAGTFIVNGPYLQLDYSNSEPDQNSFLHMIDNNTLVIDYIRYTRVL